MGGTGTVFSAANFASMQVLAGAVAAGEFNEAGIAAVYAAMSESDRGVPDTMAALGEAVDGYIESSGDVRAQEELLGVIAGLMERSGVSASGLLARLPTDLLTFRAPRLFRDGAELRAEILGAVRPELLESADAGGLRVVSGGGARVSGGGEGAGAEDVQAAVNAVHLMVELDALRRRIETFAGDLTGDAGRYDEFDHRLAGLRRELEGIDQRYREVLHHFGDLEGFIRGKGLDAEGAKGLRTLFYDLRRLVGDVTGELRAAEGLFEDAFKDMLAERRLYAEEINGAVSEMTGASSAAGFLEAFGRLGQVYDVSMSEIPDGPALLDRVVEGVKKQRQTYVASQRVLTAYQVAQGVAKTLARRTMKYGTFGAALAANLKGLPAKLEVREKMAGLVRLLKGRGEATIKGLQGMGDIWNEDVSGPAFGNIFAGAGGAEGVVKRLKGEALALIAQTDVNDVGAAKEALRLIDVLTGRPASGGTFGHLFADMASLPVEAGWPSDRSLANISDVRRFLEMRVDAGGLWDPDWAVPAVAAPRDGFTRLVLGGKEFTIYTGSDPEFLDRSPWRTAGEVAYRAPYFTLALADEFPEVRRRLLDPRTNEVNAGRIGWGFLEASSPIRTGDRLRGVLRGFQRTVAVQAAIAADDNLYTILNSSHLSGSGRLGGITAGAIGTILRDGYFSWTPIGSGRVVATEAFVDGLRRGDIMHTLYGLDGVRILSPERAATFRRVRLSHDERRHLEGLLKVLGVSDNMSGIVSPFEEARHRSTREDYVGEYMAIVADLRGDRITPEEGASRIMELAVGPAKGFLQRRKVSSKLLAGPFDGASEEALKTRLKDGRLGLLEDAILGDGEMSATAFRRLTDEYFEIIGREGLLGPVDRWLKRRSIRGIGRDHPEDDRYTVAEWQELLKFRDWANGALLRHFHPVAVFTRDVHAGRVPFAGSGLLGAAVLNDGRLDSLGRASEMPWPRHMHGRLAPSDLENPNVAREIERRQLVEVLLTAMEVYQVLTGRSSDPVPPRFKRISVGHERFLDAVLRATKTCPRCRLWPELKAGVAATLESPGLSSVVVGRSASGADVIRLQTAFPRMHKYVAGFIDEIFDENALDLDTALLNTGNYAIMGHTVVRLWLAIHWLVGKIISLSPDQRGPLVGLARKGLAGGPVDISLEPKTVVRYRERRK